MSASSWGTDSDSAQVTTTRSAACAASVSPFFASWLFTDFAISGETVGSPSTTPASLSIFEGSQLKVL